MSRCSVVILSLKNQQRGSHILKGKSNGSTVDGFPMEPMGQLSILLKKYRPKGNKYGHGSKSRTPSEQHPNPH